MLVVNEVLAAIRQPLLVHGDAFLVHDLLLDGFDSGIRGHVKRNGLTVQRLDKDLELVGLRSILATDMYRNSRRTSLTCGIWRRTRE